MDQAEYFEIDYGEAIEAELRTLAAAIHSVPTLRKVFDPRWLAMRLLEAEADISHRVEEHPGGESVLRAAEASRHHLMECAPHGVDIALADQRYEFISQVLGWQGSG